MARTVFTVSQETVTHQRVEDADQFGEAFERVLDRLKCRRLVIAFDDLDRCSPDKVTEMLATIKTFLEPKSDDREVVFVIAAAEDELRRHLIRKNSRPVAEARTESTRNSGGDPSGCR